MEALIVIVMIGSFWLGINFIDTFRMRYGEMPIDVPMSCLTSLFLVFAVFAWSGGESSAWMYVWLVAAIITYVLALRSVRKIAKEVGADSRDTVIGMLAQALLPLGTALMILFLLVAVFGAGGGKKGKKGWKRRK